MSHPAAITQFRDKKWFTPFLWSLAAHLLLVVWAMFIYPGGLNFLDNAKTSFKLKGVQSLKGGGKAAVQGAPQIVKTIQFSQNSPAQVVRKLGKTQTGINEAKVPKVAKTEEPIRDKAVKFESQATEDIQTILNQTEERSTGEKVEVKPSSTAEYYQRQAAQSTQVKPLTDRQILNALDKPLDKIQLYSPPNVSIDAEEGMPGFMPLSPETGGNGGTEYGSTIGEPDGTVTKYESLDKFLDIAVYTYENTKTAKKYFMIKIFAKDLRAFHVMPKELFFAIDCSLSIRPDRLEAFKKGISRCLKNLNKNDLFNIVAFKDEVIFFSPHSLPATPNTIKRAEKFVANFSPTQRTDVYAAFEGIIERPLSRRPSDVILISDGRPTSGIVNSRDLINSVTLLNKKTRPVFAFSGGAKVNRYLLDFIAYQNRGWSEFIKKTSNIEKGLAQFYDKIRDPLFLNLRYRLNGLDEEEVFPKFLPDFYKNAEFTLYGTYAGEQTFSMQLLGDVDGTTKELIFTRSLKDAPKGTEEIMKGYAFNKIYHLISRMTEEGENPKIIEEINALSRRYSVTTPYSPEVVAKGD